MLLWFLVYWFCLGARTAALPVVGYSYWRGSWAWRNIQGNHYLSDVVFAFWMVYACGLFLAWRYKLSIEAELVWSHVTVSYDAI